MRKNKMCGRYVLGTVVPLAVRFIDAGLFPYKHPT